MNSSVGRVRHEPSATWTSTHADTSRPRTTLLRGTTVPTTTRAGMPSWDAARAMVAAYCSSLPAVGLVSTKPLPRRSTPWPAR